MQRSACSYGMPSIRFRRLPRRIPIAADYVFFFFCLCCGKLIVSIGGCIMHQVQRRQCSTTMGGNCIMLDIQWLMAIGTPS